MKPTPAQRAFAEQIGWQFWGLIESMERMGWESPESAVPYVKNMRSPIADLVLWACGNDKQRAVAQERLLDCLPEWRPVLQARIDDVLKGRAA